MAAPENNTNALKWTLEKSIKLMTDAFDMSTDRDNYVIGSGQNAQIIEGNKYHYIGEIAADLGEYPDLLKYLKEQYPEAREIYNRIKARLESNCFSDSKKGIIKEATAIMNLKSNYSWTDRIDNTTKGNEINNRPQIIFTDESKGKSEISEDLED